MKSVAFITNSMTNSGRIIMPKDVFEEHYGSKDNEIIFCYAEGRDDRDATVLLVSLLYAKIKRALINKEQIPRGLVRMFNKVYGEPIEVINDNPPVGHRGNFTFVSGDEGYIYVSINDMGVIDAFPYGKSYTDYDMVYDATKKEMIYTPKKEYKAKVLQRVLEDMEQNDALCDWLFDNLNEDEEASELDFDADETIEAFKSTFF